MVFVSSRKGNYFMTELLEGVASVLREEGVPVDLTFDRFPQADGQTGFVFIPHEFFATVPQEWWPTTAQLRRTISFCVEMPGTQWFELTASCAGQTGGAVAINRSAAEELRRRGIRTQFFQLGYAPFWDHWHRDLHRQRPTDVVYMGSTDSRRDAFLSGYSELLWRYQTKMLIPSTAPRTERQPEYLIGEEKYGLLAASKVLINLHRGDSRSLEWARVLEAMVNGCVVASEHSLDAQPLRAGEHYLSCAPESVGAVVDHLLRDPDLLSGIRRQGYDFVRTELSMAPASLMLAELAADLLTTALPRGVSLTPCPYQEPAAAAPTQAASSADQLGVELARLRAGLLRLSTETSHLRAAVHGLVTRSRHGNGEIRDEVGDGLDTVWSTEAFARAAPRVSVLVPLYNHAHHVNDCLVSVMASTCRDIEVLVCDDASLDGSSEVALETLKEHPWFPATLLLNRVNEGPSRVRNKLARRARGEFLFLLDSDNRIYPPTIERLVEVLDTAPTASFAYAILGVHTCGEPTGLLSRVSWNPALLRDGNYIDTMSLIRRDDFMNIGGFCEDPRLTQLEDYDLWCRFASHGRTGVSLPQILGWYRQTDHSRNVSWEIGQPEALSLIQERSPELFSIGINSLATDPAVEMRKVLSKSPGGDPPDEGEAAQRSILTRSRRPAERQLSQVGTVEGPQALARPRRRVAHQSAQPPAETTAAGALTTHREPVPARPPQPKATKARSPRAGSDALDIPPAPVQRDGSLETLTQGSPSRG